MSIPLAVVVSSVAVSPHAYPAPVDAPAPAATVPTEYLLVVIRGGRVVVAAYLPSDTACLTAARMHRFAIQREPGYRPDSTGHSAIICTASGKRRSA